MLYASRLFLQLVVLKMVVGKSRRQWVINLYCYINTFSLFIS